MKLKIKTSKYNEVSPKEIGKLLEHGAEIKKSQYFIGVFIGKFTDKKGNEIKVYSDDDIEINNIVLPLSKGCEEYYNCEIEININK